MSSSSSYTIGGKGSTLTSSTIFTISTSPSPPQILLDSSLSPKSPKNPQNPISLSPIPLSLLSSLSPPHSRASLLTLLSKLTSSPTHIRYEALSLICKKLNENELGEVFIEGKEEEREWIEGCVKVATVEGVSALLDYEVGLMILVGEAVSALSIEAARKKVQVNVFNGLVDSGDGKCLKDEAGVAGDVRVLLNGSSNLANGVVVGGNSDGVVERVVEVFGSLREAGRGVHGRVRVRVNLGAGGSGGGGGRGWEGVLVSLMAALKNVGEESLRRVEGNVEGIGSEGLRERFENLGKCPKSEKLKEVWKTGSEAALEEDYVKLVCCVDELFELVRVVVGFEMLSAVLVLIEGEGAGVGESGGGNGNVVGEKKKSDKKKKKVLGKGTNVILQVIRDRIGSLKSLGDDFGNLEKVVDDFCSFLDPKVPAFVEFAEKVKEIVESNESRRLPKLPKGTRDFAKEQMTVREKAFSIITDVFKRHGATALDTPVFEMRETLMGKYGEDSKLIYDLADQGGELCSLRYDLTVPFARYVAMNSLTSFKRYQIAKVYRRDNPSKGRYREFYQCDFDIAGQFEKMGPDFEVVKILTELLDELNIGEYEVKLNHRKLLDGMLDICGVPAEKFRTICSSVDKLDKLSFDQVKKEMVEEKGLTAETADRIGTFVKERGSPLELLTKLKQEGNEFLKHEGSANALNELEILFKALQRAKCVDRIVFDLSLARGLDYYTGVIFEVVFKGTTQVGSIAAGGRYDNLIGMFGSKQVPAIGMSLGIERVFAIMEQNQKDHNQVIRANETQVLVGVMGDDLTLAAELVSELWSAKIKAEYILVKKVTKIFERAEGSAIPYAVMVGDRELNAGIVKVRDVKAKKEDSIPREKMVEELQSRLQNSC